MTEAGIRYSVIMLFLQENHELLQFLACLAGTLIGTVLVIFAFVFRRTSPWGKTKAVPLTFVILLVLGCSSYLAPLGTLNGDGAVHQEKMWFMSEAIRHGRFPEWSFYWFGGGLVSECYGPLYYATFAIPMIITGMSSKWSIALIILTCSAISGALIVRLLSPKYGMFAAVLAAACHLFSPARTGAYWYDGTPHRLVIDFICLIYVLYLWRNLSKAPAYRIGLFLGAAASACVYFHLQFGGIATLLLFLFTAITLAFDKRIALARPVVACLMGLVVFLPTAGLHYVYYFSAKPDLVAEADSLLYMIAPINESMANFAAASIWDWGSRSWEVHYFGMVPLVLSVLGAILLFKVDRYSFWSSVFVLVIYVGTAMVPRIAVFAPVFFVPTVAAVLHNACFRLPCRWQQDDRIRWLGLAISLAALVDIYPSSFQLPYRPGSGDRPVAEALANIGPSRGRIVVSSPDKQYENNAADRFGDLHQVNSASIFGPTFQLSSRMLGYAAMISRQAWREFEETGMISHRSMDYLALLDVSDILLYKRDQPIVRVQVPGFRPAWRIEKFICDPLPGALTKLNWDEIRGLGLGVRNDTFDNDTEILMDTSRGVVQGIRIDCTLGDVSSRLTDIDKSAGSETVTDARYDAGMSTAEFSIDTQQPGLFLLPFGYTADLRIEANGRRLAVRRTNEWMSVIELPAGHSDIRITAPPRYATLRRAVDGMFVLVLLTMGIRRGSARWRRQQISDCNGILVTGGSA